MKRALPTILGFGAVAAAVGLAACQEEAVLGYCEAGDTCRYDTREVTTVRNYSGYFPVQNDETLHTARADTSPTSPSAMTTTAAAATVVAVSN